MKTYIIMFRNGEKTEQKADWFTLNSDLGNATGRFYKKEEGDANSGELIAAFSNVQSIMLKTE